MKTSSEQLSLDFEAPSTRAISPGISNQEFSFATYGPLAGLTRDPAYAATSRIAGRINAASVSDKERNILLKERQKLLDKKFEGIITPRDLNRLEYIRWSLDRIEDARYGGTLEALESSVAQYERFRDELRALFGALREELPRRRR